MTFLKPRLWLLWMPLHSPSAMMTSAAAVTATSIKVAAASPVDWVVGLVTPG